MYNVIHWTDIYPVDSVIQPLNYWGLQVIFSFTSLLKGALRELLDKFAKINTEHHYNTRLSAKECFSVKFSRTDKNEKIFY